MLRRLANPPAEACDTASPRAPTWRTWRSPREPYRRYQEKLEPYNCSFAASVPQQHHAGAAQAAAAKFAAGKSTCARFAAAE